MEREVDWDIRNLGGKMSGETERQVSGWTVDTLKELVELHVVSITESLQVFKKTTESDFVKTNEFRGALDDLGRNMATRRELESSIKNVNELYKELSKQVSDLRSRLDIGPAELAELQRRIDTSSGKSAGLNAFWGYLVGVVGLIIAIISFMSRFL
jgi:tetrahydromethanopterin S-methyltransferase subunit B